jgi:hypothetical protein
MIRIRKFPKTNCVSASVCFFRNWEILGAMTRQLWGLAQVLFPEPDYQLADYRLRRSADVDLY